MESSLLDFLRDITSARCTNMSIRMGEERYAIDMKIFENRLVTGGPEKVIHSESTCYDLGQSPFCNYSEKRTMGNRQTCFSPFNRKYMTLAGD